MIDVFVHFLVNSGVLLISVCVFQDVDAVWHPRVLGAGDHPEQGTQQSRGLVGARDSRLRDARRVRLVVPHIRHPKNAFMY